MKWLGNLFSGAWLFVVGIKAYLIVAASVVSIGAVGGFYAGYRWEHGELVKLQLADALATQDALDNQHIIDTQQAAVNLRSAVAEQARQDKLQQAREKTHETITKYVSPVQDARSRNQCGISVGFIRVMRAAAQGIAPEALDLAPGQSDDDCANIAPSALADIIAQELGAGVQNAEQLTALQTWIRENHAAQELP